ncbi:hypothetical protein EJ03DRAFT_327609 [Teratosphaeria nubilosa]|uniref:High-temperature-induced dauer-formation protein n=1 Tax=Teratosphaeria nubilosa TaxID=161662 RepID=A0A6G1LAB3_9PEZI|nr:hypothetical protein EJ03DRAFT_327609 [Teratosphaeria nubilosa]
MGASESKLAFKEEVFRLAREDNLPVDSATWPQFYQLPESADDVFSLWSPTDIRNLTLNGGDHGRPAPGSQVPPRKNLETLIYTCVARLEALQTAQWETVTPGGDGALEVLNCARILTRLMPYIYEADHLHDWEQQFFWRKQKPQRIWDKRHNRPGPWFDGLHPRKKLVPPSDGDVAEMELGEPLGERLVRLLAGYMFFQCLTLPRKLDEHGYAETKVAYHIWNSGIGCRQSVGMTKENEKNAAEIVRLLLALCSRQMYIAPHVVAEVDVNALTVLTSRPERQIALSMICSLLNTVLKYNPATWRVPMDFTMEADPKTRLVNLSLQLLLVLILYPDPTGDANQYRKSISRLHRVEDFQFIQQGLTTVLTQPVSGVTIPGIQRSIPWAPEMLILFWELLQVNKRFRAFIIETDRAHDFVVLVLYYAMLHKDEPSKQGMVRMCVLILQTMSVEALFGQRLNKEFIGQESLPTLLRIRNFHGSYADFLITSIHTLMTTTQGRLESIYPALLAIINNIAPYMQNLQRATSSKLIDLFAQLSSPKFLLDKDGNHVLLASLLQAFNAIIQHQYSTNPRFIEVVLRSRRKFQALREFTIEGAQAELDRQAQERKDRGEQAAGIRSPMQQSRNGSIDSIRSPVSVQSPRLHNVPENGAFAIGEDDEDEEHAESLASSTTFSPSASVEDIGVPLQSRSMSEKARGKQPVGQESFSRVGSRHSSTVSLPALVTSTSALSQSVSGPGFVPTAQWLETWLPHLQLHTLLSLVEGADSKHSPGTNPPTPDSIQSQAFIWTSLSLGWYMSLLWGLTYASDSATHKGINGIWTGTGIKLFSVLASQGGGISLKSPKGAVDFVGDTIAKRVASFSLGGSSSPSAAASGGGSSGHIRDV